MNDTATHWEIVRRLGSYPLSAISRMTGAPESVVREVADAVGYSDAGRTSVRGYGNYMRIGEAKSTEGAGEPHRPLHAPGRAREWRTSMPPAVKRAMAEIAKRHGLTVDDITGPAQNRVVSRCRQEVYAVIRDMRNATGEPYSLPLIGAWCGGRDHTSVLQGVRVHEARVMAAKTKAIELLLERVGGV